MKPDVKADMSDVNFDDYQLVKDIKLEAKKEVFEDIEKTAHWDIQGKYKTQVAYFPCNSWNELKERHLKNTLKKKRDKPKEGENVCHGFGQPDKEIKESKICPNCGGKGIFKDNRKGAMGMIQCSKCNGTGKITFEDIFNETIKNYKPKERELPNDRLPRLR